MFTENKTTEFKREFVSDIKKTIISFANCDGGTLYIGIEDNGNVWGVENIDETMLQTVNTIRDSIRPDVSMFTDIKDELIDGKKVVRVDVSRGTARPYYLSNKGLRSEGVYIRQGASNVPASESVILKMIKDTAGDSYEAARSIEQNLTFNKAGDFFAQKDLSFGTAQMKSLHIIGKDNTFTNLGFLLSEQCTHSIKLAVFDGSTKTVFRNRAEFSGSLFTQLEDAFSYIDRYNSIRSEFSGMYRVDMRDYPTEAIREALFNSIVHRDYSFNSPTLISIFDDRMEFLSVGGLVKGLSLEDINFGVSALRNPDLANIFYRLELIEAYGTGILKIKECYSNYDVKPLLEVTNNAFKITLPNTNFKRSKSYNKNHEIGEKAPEYISSHFPSIEDERINKVLDICKRKGFVVRKDIEEELNTSQATAINILKDMTNKGLLTKTGNARNIRYYISHC